MGVAYTQLTEGERNQIYALRKGEKSQREIAELMGRSPSTISRELKRNTGRRGYRPIQAERLARERRRKPRTQKVTPEIMTYIEDCLEKEWSPEQISGTMENVLSVRISTERIYQHIWENKKAGGELYKKLRIAGNKKRRKTRGSKDWRGRIPDRVDIDQRPSCVDKKERVGDWEADLVSGAHHKGFLVTLVERKQKITVIGHVNHKTAYDVQNEIIRILEPLKEQVHTITFDNGREFSGHKAIAEALDCSCYFAKPYHSWERGLNENTNGLIRQYLPKQSDLRNISPVTLLRIMDRLNNRPRKSLDYKTPNELFFKGLFRHHRNCT